MGPAVADDTTVSMRNGITNRGPEQADGTFVAVERKEETGETSAEKWLVFGLFFIFFFNNNYILFRIITTR